MKQNMRISSLFIFFLIFFCIFMYSGCEATPGAVKEEIGTEKHEDIQESDEQNVVSCSVCISEGYVKGKVVKETVSGVDYYVFQTDKSAVFSRYDWFINGKLNEESHTVTLQVTFTYKGIYEISCIGYSDVGNSCRLCYGSVNEVVSGN